MRLTGPRHPLPACRDSGRKPRGRVRPRRTFVASAVAAALLAAWAPGAALALDRALVIGVNAYPGITVGGLVGQKDLGGAVFDAKTFQGLLTSQFGVAPADIHVLLDAEATRERILGEFRTWLVEGTGAGDRVFFYFAGHGAAVRVQDPDTGTSRMTSAIVPADAHGDLAQQPLGIQGMILGVEMRGLLDQLAGRNVTVVADSCQSGSVSRDALHPFILPPTVRVRTLTPTGAVGMTAAAFAADTTLRRNAKLNSRILEIEPAPAASTGASASSASAAPAPPASGSLAVWSAATTDQVTFDLSDRPGGVFTQNFADGLRDKKATLDAQGHVTPSALLNFVRDQAQVFCGGAGPACSAGLTPQLISAPDYLTAELDAGAGAGTGASTGAGAPATPDAAPQAQSPKPTGQVIASALDAVLSHHNDFALDVQVLPGTALKIGQVVHFRLTSGESGKVAAFDLTPDGDLTQIFPNSKTDRQGRVRANAPFTMPDAFWGISIKAKPPAGAGALLVLVTEDGVDISKATGLDLDFKPIQRTSRILQVIGTEVAKPVVSPKLEEPTRAARWAFVRVPYTVSP